MKLKIINENFTVCKIKDISKINFDDEFVFVGKTDDELSLVCITENVPENFIDREDGWKAFRIEEGQLDFSLIGILSKISGILAEGNIGIFAVSTYNTDYIMVKEENLANAKIALIKNGYNFC